MTDSPNLALADEIERRLGDTPDDWYWSIPLYPKQYRAIIAALRAQPSGDWISVGERLPEDWTLVIAVNDAGAMCILNHIWQNKQYPKLGYLGSLEEERYDGVQDRLQNITHWMPLPQPPALSAAKERGR